jgi:hypothetical protein
MAPLPLLDWPPDLFAAANAASDTARRPPGRRPTKKIVPADATKSVTEPFPLWTVKAAIAAFSGSEALPVRTSKRWRWYED